jgi:hypothetical protein
MAADRVESDPSSKCLDNNVRIKCVSDCESCLNIKRELQEMHEELRSARLIIKLLQTEGNIANTNNIETNLERDHDVNSNEWKIVSANKFGANRTIPVQQLQPIPTIINRYKALDNLNIYPQTQQQGNT